MSPTIMSSHEIIELTEKHDFEPKISGSNTRKQPFGKSLKKHTIEDDINKLFEAIEIGGSRRQPEGQTSDIALHKSAMKRPMRVGPPQVSGIDISEQVSLKQALRGLCISQASEMAAVKKRMSRPSASPGNISEAGSFKKLQISLVPEKTSSNFSDKAPESENVKGQSSTNVVCDLSRTEIEHNTTLELPCSSSNGQLKEREDKLKSASLSSSKFNVEREVTKSSKRDRVLGLSKPTVRTNQNIAKKKIVQKRNLVAKSCSQLHNEVAEKHSDQMVHRTPDSIPEKTSEEESPPSSSNSIVNHVPNIFIKSKTVVVRDDSRSRSKGEFSQSSKSSIGEYSSTTSYSEESSISGCNRSGYRPHMSKDLRWEAIRSVQKKNGGMGLRHFKLLRKIGGGDIGTVYLSELIGTGCFFAVKIMDNDFLVSRKKMARAKTEKEILEILDHPFLPTLYAHFTTSKYSCLVMEYCPGGDLHVLRQKQVSRSFPEKAARFYAAEVLLTLEYLHMLGVVYRDLKPENILVREDGHIMLSDFDLSLRCPVVSPVILLAMSSSSSIPDQPQKPPTPCSYSSCIDPFCLQPSWQLSSCFTPRFLSKTSKHLKAELVQVIPLPQLVVEPTSARSNSFVGTHEYLAPEIVRGEGHGSAVDWWTFGVFLYELLYGVTPFKGPTNEETVSNVVSRRLEFPRGRPMVSDRARDLIGRLLRKEPGDRMGSARGATEIKRHPFFEGLNWALIRCEVPPEMPAAKLFDVGGGVNGEVSEGKIGKVAVEFEDRGDGVIEFEMF